MLDQFKERGLYTCGDSGIRYLQFLSKIPDAVCILPHWHDVMELLYLVSGRMKIYVNEVPMELLPGQLAVFPPQTLHGALCGAPNSLYHAFLFDVERFYNGTGASEKWLKPLRQGKLSFPGVVSDPQVTEAARQLVVLKEAGERDSMQAVGQLYILLDGLFRLSTPGSRVPSPGEESLRSVLEYIDAHYTEDLTVRRISREFSYNETYFCRRFKKVTGLTITEYIRILRLELAQKLLKTEKCEIRDIAWRCGFPDESYFSRAFRLHTGMTPRQFRKQTK